MNTVAEIFKPRPAPGLLFALLLGLSIALAACDPDPKVTTQEECDELLDQGAWDAAIEVCSQIETDEGYSKTAQAYMGRAGISLLALIDKVGSTDLEGLALMLNAFTVTSAQFPDVQQAIDYLLLIGAPTNTDYFNLIVSSDVALSTLLKNELDITVDPATGAITIPGITDANLASLDPTAPATVQDALNNVYGATYYSADPNLTDLIAVSSYVQANAIGSTAIDLGELSDLDFATLIDNGACALSAGQTASGADDTADGPLVAQRFPRRLNTSEPTAAAYLADELQFVLLNGTTVDSTREWKGSFILPSRLLNPDYLQVECGQAPAGAQAGEFGLCMAAGAILIAGFSGLAEPDGTAITCGGTCTNFPVLAANGNPLDDEYGAQGTAAKTQLAAVLHQLYPIDNADASPATSGLHCVAGDGWVHAREYDYYLRTLGQ